MIRRNKDVDWSKHLSATDATYLNERIDPDGWYPMAVFERMGNGILTELAHDDLYATRIFGSLQVDSLRALHPTLLVERDPVETLMRFRTMRATFFDFDALDVTMLVEGHARIAIRYYMGARAEEAASHQTMGFFERLLELGGARDVRAHFLERSWAGDPQTILELEWKSG